MKPLTIAAALALAGCSAREESVPQQAHLLEATAACSAPAAPFDLNVLAPAAPTASADFRRDHFLPRSDYPEADIPDPVNGGRVQIATVATAAGTFKALRILNENANALVTQGRLDWFHVWPHQVRAGDPVFVTFHSRQPDFKAGAQIPFVIRSDTGAIAKGTVTLAQSPVRITYVTQSAEGTTLLVHLQNQSGQAHTLDTLQINGRDATASACLPQRMVRPGETVLWMVPLARPPQPGAAWTVVARFGSGTVATAVGRFLAPVFPIHSWPSSSECPFPGMKEENFAAHVARAFDTLFVRQSYADQDDCGTRGGRDTARALRTKGFYTLADNNIPKGLSLADGVIGRLLGDEADASFSLTGGTDRTRRLMKDSAEIWRTEPGVATYVGGSRNRFTGVFAGSTDIQGMDYYIAACAPHVTRFMHRLKLRASYDYARNTRLNHMPLPTWIYAQGLFSGWNSSTPILGNQRQPDAHEIRIQAMSTIAAGAKGLMWFQTKLSETRSDRGKRAWQAIGEVNRDVRAVRDFLREGDPTGRARSSNPDVLVEAIRARDAIVVPVVNAVEKSAPSDILCAAGADEHWSVGRATPSLRVSIPADFPLHEVLEIQAGKMSPWTRVRLEGRDAVLDGVELSQETPTRLFVLAANGTVRKRIRAALQQ